MNNNLFDHEQEGFLTKKSITRSLYRLKLEYEMLARDEKKAAFINPDLENAFDSVWHNWLLLKVWTARVRGLLFKYGASFSLAPRCQTKTWRCDQPSFQT